MDNKIKPVMITRVTAFTGIIIGILYLPFTPVYFPGSLSEGEIALWGFLVLFLSVILLLGTFSRSKWSKVIIITTLVFLFLLNLASTILYLQYLPEEIIGPSPYEEFKPSSLHLVPHLVLLLLIVISAYRLLKKQKSDTDTSQH